jgi:hypothetical protein
MKTETLDKTDNNMIFIERDKPLTREEVENKLTVLKKAIEDSENDIGSVKIKEAIKATVPTFHEPGELNATAENTQEFKDSEDSTDTTNT